MEPLTDKDLATLLLQQRDIEARLRATLEGTRDTGERTQAETAGRHATAARRALESWIAARSIRANGLMSS